MCYLRMTRSSLGMHQLQKLLPSRKLWKNMQT
ncbi:hypothetical protein LINPERHAP1_LOCUS31889 [Linum perenne]